VRRDRSRRRGARFLLLFIALPGAVAALIAAAAAPPAPAQTATQPASAPLSFLTTAPVLTFHPNGTATTTVQLIESTSGATAASFELILLPSRAKAVSKPCLLDNVQTVTLALPQRFDTSLTGATLLVVPAASAAGNPCRDQVALASIPSAKSPPLSAALPPGIVTLTLRRDTDLVGDFFAPLAIGLVFSLLVVGRLLYVIARLPIEGIPALQWTRRHPIKAGSSWNFKDSIATNVTAAGSVLLAVIAAAGATSTLFPGVDLTRFGLLSAFWGGLVLIAPLLLGLRDESGDPPSPDDALAALREALRRARAQLGADEKAAADQADTPLGKAAAIADQAYEALAGADREAAAAEEAMRAANDSVQAALAAAGAAQRHHARLSKTAAEHRRPATAAGVAAGAVAATTPAAAAVLARAPDQGRLPAAAAAGRAANALAVAAANAALRAAEALAATADAVANDGSDPEAARAAGQAALALRQAATATGLANRCLIAAASTAATAAVATTAAHQAARALPPVQRGGGREARRTRRAVTALEIATGNAGATARVLGPDPAGSSPLATAAGQIAADLVAAASAANAAIGAELPARPTAVPSAVESWQAVASLLPSAAHARPSAAPQDAPGVYASFWLVVGAAMITLIAVGAQLATIARMGLLADTTTADRVVVSLLLAALALLVGWYASNTLATLVESQADRRGPRTSLNAFPSTAHVL